MRSVELEIGAAPEVLYDLVSDISRTGEWSPENRGGAWLDGATGPAVGARFKASNKRRLPWATTCTVTAAERGRAFSFVVGAGETAWHYSFAARPDGTLVTESFDILRPPGRLGRALTRLATGVPWSEREDDLEAGMRATLDSLRASAEARMLR